jgi:DNA primase
MNTYIDFSKLKEKVSIEMVLEMLGIRLKKSNNQLRGPCPIHQGNGEREFVVTPSKNLYYCFAGCGGGDQIKLAANILKIGQKDAAREIAKCYGTVLSDNSTVTKGGNSTVPPSPLRELDYLLPEHEAVEAVGFDKATAQALGVGYAAKGLMRGTVAVPVRLPDGTLAGYIGITEAKLPPRFHLEPSNIVRFPKKTA